jgi:hypothetical protein
MMTSQQIELLQLGIPKANDRVTLIVESGLEWVKENTTLDFDITKDEDLKALPSCVRLFLMKFYEINGVTAGVASESIEGLSQSFRSDSADSLIWSLAEELLGSYLKSRVRFVTAQNRWE